MDLLCCLRGSLASWRKSCIYAGFTIRGRRRLCAQARYAASQGQQKMEQSVTNIRHQNLYPAPIPMTSLRVAVPLLKLVQSRLYSSEKIRYVLGL